MERIPILHRRPFIVSGIFALLAAGVIVLGIYRLNVLSDFDAPGYILMGILLLVTALTIAVVYGLQEKQFRKAMRQPLMIYTLDPVWLKEIIAKNSAEIRGQNKVMLLVMVFFCALMAIIFLFLGEDGRMVSLAMVGLAFRPLLAAQTRYYVAKDTIICPIAKYQGMENRSINRLASKMLKAMTLEN